MGINQSIEKTLSIKILILELVQYSDYLSLNDLCIDNSYSFILACNEFSLFPLKKEYLLILSTKQKAEKPV